MNKSDKKIKRIKYWLCSAILLTGLSYSYACDTKREIVNNEEKEIKSSMMNVEINGNTLKVKLESNSSAKALEKLLASGALTLEMDDYGNMEKVGPLGHTLPRNDKHITAQPGDVILYQGDKLVIYHRPNSWSFTKIGEVQGLSADEIREKMGVGKMKVTLTLEE